MIPDSCFLTKRIDADLIIHFLTLGQLHSTRPKIKLLDFLDLNEIIMF
jgi:hypothetical protein